MDPRMFFRHFLRRMQVLFHVPIQVLNCQQVGPDLVPKSFPKKGPDSFALAILKGSAGSTVFLFRM